MREDISIGRIILVKRNYFLVFILILSIFVISCSNIQKSSKRVGKDFVVFASYPIHAPVASALDAFESTKEKPFISIPTVPINFFVHFIKHTYATVPYIIDIPCYPFYLFFGPRSIMFYKINGFPYEFNSDVLTKGARRASVSEMVFFGSPVASFIAAAHNSYLYWESHPIKRYFYEPILYPAQVIRHFCYSMVYGIDFCFFPITLIFAEKPLALYNWENYPFEVAPHLNKASNRIYKTTEIVFSTPIGIFTRSGYDFGKAFKKHPVATTIFSFVVYPYQMIKHLVFHISYMVDLLGSPFHFFNLEKKLDTYELYITGSFETHPVEKKILGQRVIAFMITMSSAMEEAAAQKAYNDNPTPANYQRLMQARKDSAANAVTANTYLQQALAMREALSNVRGFRRPKTSMEFLKFLGEGRETMDALENGPSLGTSDVPEKVSASGMEKYRDVMNLVLYQREKKLFEECRRKILSQYGSIEISGSRVDQLAHQADIANLIQIQDALMEAYLAIPGTKGEFEGSIDELGDCCDKVLDAIDREIDKEDSPFENMLRVWRRKVYNIKIRAYTQDAIYSETRKLLSEGYLKIYEYQMLK